MHANTSSEGSLHSVQSDVWPNFWASISDLFSVGMLESLVDPTVLVWPNLFG